MKLMLLLSFITVTRCFAADIAVVRVVILGQVEHPGRLDVPAGSSIDAVIQLAGGLTKSADLTRGVAVSTSPATELDLKTMKRKFFIRFDDQSFGPIVLKQIKVEEGDVIWVNERVL